MNIKRLALSTAIIASAMTVTTPALAWKIVFDPTAVAQAIQQYYQLQAQYQAMKQQLESMTGQYNVASGTKSVQDIIPGSWQDVARTQSGAFGTKQATYDKLMQVIPRAEMDKLMQNGQFANNYNTVRMGMAVSDASYEALNEHIHNLQVLSAKINTTRNIKEAQDLGNQIAIEQTYISAINARLGAVQTSLSSTASNDGVSSTQKINAWNK